MRGYVMVKTKDALKSTAPRSTPRRAPTVLQVKKGQKVVCHGRAAKVRAVVSSAQIWVGYLGVDEHEWVNLDALSPYVEEAPSLAKPAALVEDNFEHQRSTQWVRAFEGFQGCASLPASIKMGICEQLGASPRTVDRHFNLYQLDASPRGQLPCRPGPEKGSSTLNAAIIAIVDQAIKERYATPERGSIKATADLARSRCDAAGLKAPCYNSVLARIKTLNRWKTARLRHGRVRGDAQAGPAGKGFGRRYKPLDFVQMDHAIVDVIVVDPDTREEIGRPWITLAIDVATRCVLGFYLTFDPPSQTSVALAMEQCCFPKDSWLKALGCDEPWLPFGVMRRIGWDNAKCFRNTNLIAACQAAGIDPQFRRVRNPIHGAHIERMIGTYMGRIHLLKGTTFSNTKERGDYKSGENAVMTLQELTLWTIHEINGRYHNAKHSALGCTPLEAWKEAWTFDGTFRLPPIPADRRNFRLSLLPRKDRVVGREGLQRFALKYWDEGLIPLIGTKQKYPVAHDPRNISRVYLLFKGGWIDVPWRDQSQPPVALWEWERAKRNIRKKHNAPASNAAIFKHIAAQRAIERTSERTTRLQRRDHQRRPKDDRPRSQAAPINYNATPMLVENPFEVKHDDIH